jgi:Tn3 transposase DDE domain
MRGLSDAVFYRPAKSIRYPHIDALFGGEIDWDLIATHGVFLHFPILCLVTITSSLTASLSAEFYSELPDRYSMRTSKPCP